MQSTLILFYNDLRLEDNPALFFAVKEKKPLILLFILEKKEKWEFSSRQTWWLQKSLEHLQKKVEKEKQVIVFEIGEYQKTIFDYVKKYNVDSVHWNQTHIPSEDQKRNVLKEKLEKNKILVTVHPGNLFINPEKFLTKQGSYFKVFTSFWKAATQDLEVDNPYPIPTLPSSPIKNRFSSFFTKECKILEKTWTPGETEAKKRFKEFISSKMADYPEERDRPDLEGTSRLSPYLHFGEISVRNIYHILEDQKKLTPKEKMGKEKYLSEIGWREFSYYLLHHFPDLPEQNFDNRFDDFPWKWESDAIKNWQEGNTGYPIVDAGMRQLLHEGWMHNRVRMIVASFLTKDLLIHWQKGALWFWDHLVDADLANNSASWQWTAGSGADAAPFFRIFNPVLQGEKFDPEGEYVKKWVPELKKIPKKYIHKPWEISGKERKKIAINLGDYPKPLVDHKKAREKALEAFEKIKKKRR